MDFSVCSQCGKEIEGKGIHYKDNTFCSDECCEEFEVEMTASEEPGLDELDESLDPGFSEDDLGYQEDDDNASEKYLDDDYDINPEDF